MDKIRLEILGLTSSQSQSGSFALILGEENGTRRMPIIIGMFEAQAIAIEMEKIKPNRPMTHDLFLALGNEFSFRVEEIIIWDLKEGVFFAHLIVTDGVRTATIDSRPSDAIAIALRFGAPIYTFENIMNEAGIQISEESDEDADEPGLEGEESATSTEESEEQADAPKEEEQKPSLRKSGGRRRKNNDLQGHSIDKLNELLNEAIEQEDYEQAARIRDELNKRN